MPGPLHRYGFANPGLSAPAGRAEGINGNLHLIGDDCIPCKACAADMGQCLVVCLVQAEHRDRGVKDMRGHHCAKRQNILLLVKDQGCWRRAIQGKLQQHATAAA